MTMSGGMVQYGGRTPANQFRQMLAQLEHVIDVSFVAPPDSGLLVDGSIAEGFGNAGSDVDVSIVVASDAALPPAPFVAVQNTEDGPRRVEVRYRSVASLHRLASSLDEVELGTRQGARILANYHRLACGYPLRRTPALDDALSRFDLEALRTTAAKHWTMVALEALRRTQAALWLGRHRAASGHARELLLRAGQAWCAAHGETYPSPKWLTLMMSRGGMSDEVVRTFRRLLVSPDGGDESAHARETIEFATQLGVPADDLARTPLTVGVARGVARWQSRDGMYLLSAGRDVYALNSEAAALWRTLFATGTSEPDPTLVNGYSRLLGELHACGLLTAYMGVWEWTETQRQFTTHEEVPAITAGGIMFSQPSRAKARWIPIPARRLAAAGSQLVFESFRVESWLEDAFGACRDEQWDILTNALHQMVRHTCGILLCSRGITGVPLDRAADALSEAGLDSDLAHEAQRLLSVTVEDRSSAKQLQSEIDAFRRSLPDGLCDPAFFGIFQRATAYLQALELSAPWKVLGQMVGVSIPQLDLDAALGTQYAAATGTTQFGMKPAAVADLLSFDRNLEFT